MVRLAAAGLLLILAAPAPAQSAVAPASRAPVVGQPLDEGEQALRRLEEFADALAKNRASPDPQTLEAIDSAVRAHLDTSVRRPSPWRPGAGAAPTPADPAAATVLEALRARARFIAVEWERLRGMARPEDLELRRRYMDELLTGARQELGLIRQGAGTPRATDPAGRR